MLQRYFVYVKTTKFFIQNNIKYEYYISLKNKTEFTTKHFFHKKSYFAI